MLFLAQMQLSDLTSLERGHPSADPTLVDSLIT